MIIQKSEGKIKFVFILRQENGNMENQWKNCMYYKRKKGERFGKSQNIKKCFLVKFCLLAADKNVFFVLVENCDYLCLRKLQNKFAGYWVNFEVKRRKIGSQTISKWIIIFTKIHLGFLDCTKFQKTTVERKREGEKPLKTFLFLLFAQFE